MKQTKQIKLSKGSYTRLKEIGSKGETFDDIVKRLLDYHSLLPPRDSSLSDVKEEEG